MDLGTIARAKYLRACMDAYAATLAALQEEPDSAASKAGDLPGSTALDVATHEAATAALRFLGGRDPVPDEETRVLMEDLTHEARGPRPWVVHAILLRALQDEAAFVAEIADMDLGGVAAQPEVDRARALDAGAALPTLRHGPPRAAPDVVPHQWRARARRPARHSPRGAAPPRPRRA